MGNHNCKFEIGFSCDDIERAVASERIVEKRARHLMAQERLAICGDAGKAGEADEAGIKGGQDDLQAVRDGRQSMREDLPSMNGDRPILKGRRRRPSVNDPFVEAGSMPVPTVPELTRELVQATLDRHFPGALPGPLFQQKLLNALKDFDFTPQNTIFGTSVCADEINTTNGTLVDGLKNYWGENFPMGGIGGAPFVGKTGFTAFSHHVPDDGNVLVLFGPHVGITASGEVGKCLREGQKAESTACGACVAAYKQVLESQPLDPDMELDMQQSWLRGQLSLQVERIQAAEEPMAEVAKVAYEAVKKKVTAIANTHFGFGYLALVGGIQINMPRGYPDYFLPFHFTLERKEVVGMHRSVSPHTALKQDGDDQGEPVKTRVACVDYLDKLTQDCRASAGGVNPEGTSTQATEGYRPAESNDIMGA